MAKYRQLYTEFWGDGFVLDLTPEEKYFYLYLMTNQKTSQCGIYELPKRIIETETGYNRDTVDKLLKRFTEYNKIDYCDKTKEIMIMNWVKYNQPNNPNAIKCVNKELKGIKNNSFVYVFYNQCQRYKLNVNKIFNDIEGFCQEQIKDSPKDNNVKANKKGVNKHFIRRYKGAYKGLVSNKVISNKEEVIKNNKKVISNSNYNKEEKNKNGSNIADVIAIFENNIHPIVPIEHETIIDWSNKFSCDVIAMAIYEAVSNNVRNIRYINKILNTWLSNGITTVKEVDSYKRDWEERKRKVENKIGSFDREGQRKYDLKEIEKKLLGWDSNSIGEDEEEVVVEEEHMEINNT